MAQSENPTMVIIEVMRSPWLDLPKGSYELRFGLDVNLIDLVSGCGTLDLGRGSQEA